LSDEPARLLRMRPFPARIAFLALLLALAARAPLRADGLHNERDDAIEVTGHYENAVGTSDAASQGYITPKLIEARPLLRPGEVLEFVPGVIVTQHSGDGKANQFFLRGFNLDHGTDFRTTVAGMPVNLPTHAHGQGYSDLNFMIPELVTRIDYKKGPYFAEEGDFSSAGAAQFHYFDRMKENIASASAGGFNYRRALFAGSPKIEDGKLLLALEAVHNDGPWVHAEGFGKVNAVLRYGHGTVEDGYEVTAMAYQGKWSSTDQIPQRAVDAGLLPRYGAIDPTDGGESQRYSLSTEMRKPMLGGQFQMGAYFIRYRLQLFSNFTYFQNNPVSGDQFEQYDSRRVLGLAPNWLWTGKLGDMQSVVKLGMHLRRDDIDKLGLYGTAARQVLSTTREDAVRETGTGLWLEHSLQWTEKFRSVAGLRGDHYSMGVASNLAANSGSKNAGIVSPKLNLIFGPWSDTEYFASWGNGFHSNDARGVMIGVDPKTLAAATPAPMLVRSKGAELGIRSEWVPKLQSSLALWRLSLASELLFAGDAGTTEASRPSLRHGIEWSNRYRPQPWLLVDADLSASKAHFTDADPAGNNIPGSIDRVAALGVSVNDRGPWSGTLQTRYFGPRPLIEDGSVRSRSTVLTNLRIGYRFDKNLRLGLDVFNLFQRKASDIDYYYASQLRGETAPVSDLHFHPVEPRSLRLTLSANF
jgi:outer membrane receptor protein involved in Fe transport